MRQGSPSGTSFLVSFARGLGVEDEVLDAIAFELLPPWLGRMARAPHRLGALGGLYRKAIRASTFGLIDHAVLRTQAIDAHFMSALHSGIDQVVILGAGLDARAWRLPMFRSTTVFEVDHPATQDYKRRHVQGCLPRAEVRYVAVDFETDRLSALLEDAGFRPDEKTAWIWEGVTMYLPLPTLTDTLAQVTALSAPGSELAVTYRTPNALPFGALGRAAIPALFKVAGEPLKATLDPRELASAVAPHWDVIYDEDARGWQQLTRSLANPSRSFLSERLAIARRRP